MITTRTTLRIVVVLGVLVTLVGGTGIFAVFTDRATTGPNTVTSQGLDRAADLTIATAGFHDPQTNPPFDCGTFSDDLQTGLFDSALVAGSGDERSICLRNDGTAALDLAMSAIDLVDTDVDCTGDEAEFGDGTCGGDAAGELSPLLRVDTTLYECTGGPVDPNAYMGNGSAPLSEVEATPQSLLRLQPGGSVCLVLRVMLTSGSAVDAQVAQSDRTVWRFAFDGTVPVN